MLTKHEIALHSRMISWLQWYIVFRGPPASLFVILVEMDWAER